MEKFRKDFCKLLKKYNVTDCVLIAYNPNEKVVENKICVERILCTSINRAYMMIGRLDCIKSRMINSVKIRN